MCMYLASYPSVIYLAITYLDPTLISYKRKGNREQDFPSYTENKQFSWV